MQLGVLDHSLIARGSNAAEAFRNTVELAQLAERLGYRRFWLAEHHGSGHFAGVAPEVLIARVASATSRIRVGSGGVLLSHYSPFKIAEVFRLLATLFPGRIDLGIGRSTGSSELTARALAYGPPAGPDTFTRKLEDVIAFATGTAPATEELCSLAAGPDAESPPEVWALGSGAQSAELAAKLGIAFCFAHFFNPFSGAPVTTGYRSAFRPSPGRPAPRSALSVYALCAPTEAEARRIARSFDLLALRTRKGQDTLPVPSVEEAEAYDYTPEELAALELDRRRVVVGDPAGVRERMLALAAEFQADEIVVTTICHDHRARLRSYELLAEAFSLAPP